jgi:hypothetical protein
MKHRTDSINTLVLILQGLGLLFTLVSSFLGAMYMFNGNIAISAFISFVFVVAMFYLVTFFIKEKANRKRKGYPPMFYYLFVVYGLLAVVLSFFMLHFCNVEFFEKKEAQEISLKKLNGIELIHAEYKNQVTQFTQNLESDIVAKLNDIEVKKKKSDNSYMSNFNALQKKPYSMSVELINTLVSDGEKAKGVKGFIDMNLVIVLQAKQKELFKVGNNTIEIADYLTDSKNKIEFWNRMKITQLTNDISERISKDYKVLNAALEDVSANEVRLFKGNTNFDQAEFLNGEILIDKPFELASKQLSLLTPLILLVFQLLILLPYFLTRGRQY